MPVAASGTQVLAGASTEINMGYTKVATIPAWQACHWGKGLPALERLIKQPWHLPGASARVSPFPVKDTSDIARLFCAIPIRCAVTTPKSSDPSGTLRLALLAPSCHLVPLTAKLYERLAALCAAIRHSSFVQHATAAQKAHRHCYQQQ